MFNIKRPLDYHSEQVKYTVHRMLWHADILEYNVSFTFREKATGDLWIFEKNPETKPADKPTQIHDHIKTKNTKWTHHTIKKNLHR